MRDARCEIRDTRYKMHDTRCKIWDLRCGMQDMTCGMHDPPNTEHRTPNTDSDSGSCYSSPSYRGLTKEGMPCAVGVNGALLYEISDESGSVFGVRYSEGLNPQIGADFRSEERRV